MQVLASQSPGGPRRRRDRTLDQLGARLDSGNPSPGPTQGAVGSVSIDRRDFRMAGAGRVRPFHAVESTAICGADHGGCAGLPGSESGRAATRGLRAGTRASVTRIFSPRPVATNPLVVPSTDFENVWNKTVAVVDKYFDIESENRLSRTIGTQPQMGATVLEPWALDSATIEDRVEASLQTIRRSAVIHVDPAPTGGFLVKVEVYKFLEDMAKPDRQAAGRAVFTNDFPVNRTREIVGPVPAPLGWIKRGRDLRSGAGHPGRHPRSVLPVATTRLRCHPDMASAHTTPDIGFNTALSRR